MTDPLPSPIRAAFGALSATGVRYVVIRGYVPLGELARSSDIDLYVSPHDRTRVGEVLATAGWLPRRFQTGRYPHRFYDNYDIPGRVCTTLDVVDRLFFGSALHELTAPEGVLTSAQSLDGVRVPAPWVAFFLLTLHIALDKGELSPANADRARALWTLCQDSPADARDLEGRYGRDARRLVEDLVGGMAAPTTRTMAALAARARALPCLSPHPVRAWIDRRRVRLAVRRARPFRVAVLGMDGAGKSTVIERATALSSGLPIGTAYLGYNQFTTTVFKWILARLDRWRVSDPPRSLRVRLLDQIRSLWWPIELYVRMRRAEWWRAIVLYDRYPFPAYDREDRPTSIPGHVMHAYEKVWTTLLPQPDAVLLCDGDPRVIWKRKEEYSFEVYTAAHARLRRLYDDFRGEKHLLRTDRPLEETLRDIPELLRTSPALRRTLAPSPTD